MFIKFGGHAAAFKQGEGGRGERRGPWGRGKRRVAERGEVGGPEDWGGKARKRRRRESM